MDEKTDILCPLCKAEGRRKKLLEVSRNASGVIYPYCKIHKRNVAVDLDGILCGGENGTLRKT
ncbi:MAG: hypothetical protein ACI4I9_01665 [Porcipelethomonas sp.]